MSKCTDKVVGTILAGWRYDISGITPEMRGDYEAHFAECDHCRKMRIIHRIIDFALIAIASVSAFVFLLAFGVIHHFAPRHTLILEIIAGAGFLFSILVWLIVAVVTPAPLLVVDAALIGASHVHNKLPPEIRDRIPSELREKIVGQA